MSVPDISRFFPRWYIANNSIPIGAGGFGEVYEIHRDQFGKTEKAALKVIHIPGNKSYINQLRANGYDDASIKTRLRSELNSFSEEYSNMRKLTHTNVVKCDDIEYESDSSGMGYTLYLKMELLTPLTTALASGYDCIEVTTGLATDICSALVQCEKHKIVHRDIKPQNLFVNDVGEYKLGDFGIARQMEHTTSGTVAGTENYMSPEVYYHSSYSANVDLYSLGLVMYWLLNEKRLPFLPLPPKVPTWEEERNANLMRLKGKSFPLPKNGSKELIDIVYKACQFDRKKRYQSASEMLADLRALGRKTADANQQKGVGTQTKDANDYKGYIIDNKDGAKFAGKKEVVQKTAQKESVSKLDDILGYTTLEKVYTILTFIFLCLSVFAAIKSTVSLIQTPAGENPAWSEFIAMLVILVIAIAVFVKRDDASDGFMIGMSIFIGIEVSIVVFTLVSSFINHSA